ncbi:MAG TPA: hypothetical protein VGA80_17925, partial [Flavobacteriaceae bacterium]
MGLIVSDETVYQINSVPLGSSSFVFGTLSIGNKLNDSFLEKLKTRIKGEISFFLKGNLIGTTFSKKDRNQIQTLIQNNSESITGEAFDLHLNGNRFFSIMIPFGEEGNYLLQRSWDEATQFLRRVLKMVLVATLLVSGTSGVFCFLGSSCNRVGKNCKKVFKVHTGQGSSQSHSVVEAFEVLEVPAKSSSSFP